MTSQEYVNVALYLAYSADHVNDSCGKQVFKFECHAVPVVENLKNIWLPKGSLQNSTFCTPICDFRTP